MKSGQDPKPFSQRPSSILTLHLRELYEAIQPEVETESEASALPREIAKNRFSLLELGILRNDSLGQEATEYLKQCPDKEDLLLLLLIQNRLLRQEITYFDQELANQANETILDQWLEAEPDGREMLERMYPEVIKKEEERQAKWRLQQRSPSRDSTPDSPEKLDRTGVSGQSR